MMPTSHPAGSGHQELPLHQSVLRALRKRGIYCEPSVTVEHQHLAKRYVLRGTECGGAVADMGRACAFVSGRGAPLPWLQTIDSVSVNGRHAVFVAEEMVRLEMLRVGTTCNLVVSRLRLSVQAALPRPKIVSRILFRGHDGTLPVDLWKPEQRSNRGSIVPTFYTRSGELLALPTPFADAIRRLTDKVCCLGCRHVHVGVCPAVKEMSL
jgi:hypothetical protein